MSGSVNFTPFLKPYASTFSFLQSFSSVNEGSFRAEQGKDNCTWVKPTFYMSRGSEQASSCKTPLSGDPFFKMWGWNGQKTPVLCGRTAEMEDKTPSSETSGYEWSGPESESRERSYCSFSTELPLFLFQWRLSSAFVSVSCPLSFMCLFRQVLLAALKGHTGHPSGLEWTIIWR